MSETEQHYSGGFLFNPRAKQVLLHKRDAKAAVNPNTWAFFGGNSEPGEAPLDTFVREIREELGISVSLEKIQAIRSYYNPDFQIYRHVFVVISSLPKSAMVLGEGEDFDWVSLDDVFAMNLTKRTHEDLEFFVRWLATARNLPDS